MAPERRRGPPPMVPERRVYRSRSRQRRKGRKDKEARAHRHRSSVDHQVRRRRSPEAPPRHRASPSARAQRANVPAPDAQDRLRACSRSPQHRLARLRLLHFAELLPSCLAAWRRATIQWPPGDFDAEPPRPPPVASACADLEFLEEWGPFEMPSLEGAAVPDAPPPVVVADLFAREFSRELSEPPRPPPAAPAGRVPRTPPDSAPVEEPAPCEFEEQGIWASLSPPPPAEASGRRTDRRSHFPRRDPRHTGPRFFHAGGGRRFAGSSTTAGATPWSSATAGRCAPTTGRTSALSAASPGTPPQSARLLRAPDLPRSRAPACLARGPSGAEATYALRVTLTARRRCRGGPPRHYEETVGPARYSLPHDVSFHSLPPRRRFSCVM